MATATPEVDAMTWLQRAACRGRDPRYWFPFEDDKNPSRWQARHPEPIRTYIRIGLAVCAVCPVRVECLHEALANDERFGIWGGLTPPQRIEFAQRKTRRAS